MPPLIEIIVAATMLIGTFLMVVAGIGLLRFPDIYCRMHAAGKAGTLGISMIILAAIIFFHTDLSVMVRGVLAIFFQFLTTPTATHLLAKASYITEYPLSDRTAVDELKAYLPSRPDETYGHE
ncbi:MAG: monovalent cation/H(+) antiporter subunit G [Phycisphaeraceae bacterium]